MHYIALHYIWLLLCKHRSCVVHENATSFISLENPYKIRKLPDFHGFSWIIRVFLWPSVIKMRVRLLACLTHSIQSNTGRKCYECASMGAIYENTCPVEQDIPANIQPVECPYGYDYCRVSCTFLGIACRQTCQAGSGNFARTTQKRLDVFIRWCLCLLRLL